MQKTEKEEENAMPVYRVIIAGCRDFQDYALLKEKCEYYLQNKLQSDNVIIVSGHASGADSLGERFAQEHCLQVELHPADWAKHCRAAGPIRNKKMAECADALIAFWDGKSKGTKNMIDLARRYGLDVSIVSYN